ncbi:MAG: exonuclease SbcCD subunit D C-terminal domain-containing protein [Bacteroidales bacterium]
MIKILHTSDLHIGKRLYQADLYPEQSLFFQWLTAYIRENQINVLLISGDVFDVANPSSESRRVYFELLRELMMLRCKVIIAGGNHDSPAVLEAPRELLKYLDIHVVGGLPDQRGDLLVPVANSQGETAAVVACIPFLRDADLRQYNSDHTHEDRLEAVRKGVVSVFEQVAASCAQQYPGIAALAMGHLFLQGGHVSESERDIQVGNLAAVEASQLPGYFSYYALGHLHKPQDYNGRFVYSGSPVQLSFSEFANSNRIMLIEADQGKVQYKSVPVPLFRRLVRMQGTVDELHNQLKAWQPQQSTLPDFIELIAEEDIPNPAKLLQLEDLIANVKPENAEILKYRIRFSRAEVGSAALYEEHQSIAGMKPADVFTRRLEKEELDDNTRQKLLEAFAELLQEVEQNMEE